MRDNALSPVLGFVLVFAIIVAMIGIIQTLFVPTWIKSVEAKHYFSLKSEFEELVEKAVDAANGGISIASFDLILNYPRYPFLLTPATTSSSITVKKIGSVAISSPILSEPIVLDLLAIEFEPNYHYLDANEEVMILGDYFSNGVILGESVLYSGNEINLIVINMSEGTYSGNERIVLYGNPPFTLNSAEVTISLDSDVCNEYSWYLNFVENSTGATRSGCNVTFSGKLNLIAASTNESWSVKLAEKLVNSSFTISDESSATPLSENTQIISSEGVTYYITGYTGYSNQPVNVTLEWSEKRGDNIDSLLTQNFVWYTLSNGYFQLPITLPEVKGNRDIILEVTLQFPDGSAKTFSVLFER